MNLNLWTPSRWHLALGLTLASLAAPAQSQVITYESMTDTATWSLANANSPWWTRGVAEPASHFGKVDRLSLVWWFEYRRKATLLAAGTYRAVIWHQKTTASGLFDLNLSAAFDGQTVTSTTAGASMNIGNWGCMDELVFTLTKPAEVVLRVTNTDSTLKRDWLFDSFVLSKVESNDVVASDLLSAWRGGATRVSSGANPFCEVNHIGAAGAVNHLLAAVTPSVPAGEYCFTARVRKIVDTTGAVQIETGSDKPFVRAQLPVAAQPVGEWVWLPFTPVTTTSAGTVQMHVHLNSSAANYEVGEFVFYRGLPESELYYNFERGMGDVAVNYGSASVNSTMIHDQTPTAWATTTRFGSGALMGSSNTSSASNHCDTGWNGAFTGDFSLSWWMKERTPMPSSGLALSYVFGGESLRSFRGFVNTNFGAGNFIIKFGTGADEIVMPDIGDSIEVRAQAADGVSVGLVVSGMSAQWYVDGAKYGAPITLAFTPSVAMGSRTIMIGDESRQTYSSIWDLDEFHFATRAASEAEMQLWHGAPSAGAGTYGQDCGGLRLGASGGSPRVGNQAYTHTIEGPANTNCLFVIGFQTQLPFDMGIAFPTLQGCDWYTQFLVQFSFPLGATGRIAIPGGLPYDTGMVGLRLDTQALGFNGSTKLLSNAVSHAVQMN